MAEMVVRPTMKFIYLGYLLVIVIVVASVVALMRVQQWPPGFRLALQPWIPWLPVLLLLWPLKRHLRNRLTKMTILDDRLRYETGLMARTTRTILISKVQDVTVHQRVSQRIFGVGDLSIETAGGSSRETIFNIDRPQEIADHINQHPARRNIRRIQTPTGPRLSIFNVVRLFLGFEVGGILGLAAAVPQRKHIVDGRGQRQSGSK